MRGSRCGHSSATEIGHNPSCNGQSPGSRANHVQPPKRVGNSLGESFYCILFAITCLMCILGLRQSVIYTEVVFLLSLRCALGRGCRITPLSRRHRKSWEMSTGDFESDKQLLKTAHSDFADILSRRKYFIDYQLILICFFDFFLVFYCFRSGSVHIPGQ